MFWFTSNIFTFLLPASLFRSIVNFVFFCSFSACGSCFFTLWFLFYCAGSFFYHCSILRRQCPFLSPTLSLTIRHFRVQPVLNSLPCLLQHFNIYNSVRYISRIILWIMIIATTADLVHIVFAFIFIVVHLVRNCAPPNTRKNAQQIIYNDYFVYTAQVAC